jgi:Holliday junction resolvase RusA-like endonuclease
MLDEFSWGYFRVEIPPMGWQRRVVRKDGRTYVPTETAEYKETVAWAYKKHLNLFYRGPVSMTIRAYYKRPKTVKREKPTVKPDLDNIAKAVCDALNGVAYHDDKQITHLSVYKDYAEEPYIELWIGPDTAKRPTEQSNSPPNTP